MALNPDVKPTKIPCEGPQKAGMIKNLAKVKKPSQGRSRFALRRFPDLRKVGLGCTFSLASSRSPKAGMVKKPSQGWRGMHLLSGKQQVPQSRDGEETFARYFITKSLNKSER
jgi:hypothetical protein